MEGIDKICWETIDISNQGCLTTKKYAKTFERYYGISPKVSAYETYITDEGTKDRIKFIIVGVKYKKKLNKLVCQIEPLNNSQVDKITRILNKIRAKTIVHSKDPTFWWPDWSDDAAKMDLANTNLSYAALFGAELNGANLSGADLSHSVIQFGDMSNVNLSKANLADAIFYYVDLINANLRSANLNGTTFFQVDMSGADLTGAINADSSKFMDIVWSNMTCPNGSTTSDSYLEWFNGIPYFILDTCNDEQLFPLA